MILTQADIGKRVRHKKNQKIYTVLATHENSVWLLTETESHESFFADSYEWELVSEEKLPSERIAELLGIEITGQCKPIPLERFIYAICHFLDEDYKRREGTTK